MSYTYHNQWNTRPPQPGDMLPCGKVRRLLPARGGNRSHWIEFDCIACGGIGETRLDRIKSGATVSCGCVGKKKCKDHFEDAVKAMPEPTKREALYLLRVEHRPLPEVAAMLHAEIGTLTTLLRFKIGDINAMSAKLKADIATAIFVERRSEYGVAREYRMPVADILMIACRENREVKRLLEGMQSAAEQAVQAITKPFVYTSRKVKSRLHEGELDKAELTVSKDRHKAKGIFAPVFHFLARFHRLIPHHARKPFQQFIDAVSFTMENRASRCKRFLRDNLSHLSSRQNAERQQAIASAWTAPMPVAA